MKKRSLSLCLTLALILSLVPVFSLTAAADKPVIDTITITSDIKAPIMDCYPARPNITVSPSQVDWNAARFDWMKRAANGSYDVASYDIVTDGTYRFRYGLQVDQNEATLADTVTVIINGQPQTVYEFSVEKGIYYFNAYSDVYTPQVLPKVPGSLRISPDSNPLQVGEKLSCVLSGGAENLDQSTLEYAWECQDTNTGRIFYYQNDQGRATLNLTIDYENYNVRARVYAEGYSGYLYSDWHMVVNTAVPHSVTVSGGTADKPNAKAGNFITITADEPPFGQVFDHWEVLSGKVTLANGKSAETTFFMLDEDVSVKAVTRAADATHTVAVGSLTVRQEPDVNSSRIGGLTKDDGVSVLETQGEWSKIIYKDGYGWVMSKYLTEIPKEPEKTNPFTDVFENEYWYDAVLWAYYAQPQVTTGINSTEFGPQQTVTRGQCVTFLWRAEGCPEPYTAANPFVDIKADEYWYKPILWAVEKGITKGTDTTHFRPYQTCSTAHIITFLYRTLDIGSDGWYQDAADWAINDYLLLGTGLTVQPGIDCPRGAIVTFLYRELGMG
ncbi:MAG: S-layer homology domain-containing protein [Oscillospiraceae bacterium]|nr:S-layer homology domain-containing protein [Oscillospiraceae bacterium]